MFDDDFADDEWLSFIDNFCRNFDIYTKENCFIYICLDWRRSHELVPFLKEKWKFSNLIVWDKIVHGLGSDYKYTHELIHVCKKGKPNEANNRNGDKEYQDIWRIQRKIGRDNDHATKKPIELVERAIKHTTSFGDIVLDLFGGSGSTTIACEKNKRTSYIMELEPYYCDVIIKRWQEFTGKDAYLESDQIKYNDKR
jgi:DNA modification methylase